MDMFELLLFLLGRDGIDAGVVLVVVIGGVVVAL
jgi:hypothetical protein